MTEGLSGGIQKRENTKRDTLDKQISPEVRTALEKEIESDFYLAHFALTEIVSRVEVETKISEAENFMEYRDNRERLAHALERYFGALERILEELIGARLALFNFEVDQSKGASIVQFSGTAKELGIHTGSFVDHRAAKLSLGSIFGGSLKQIFIEHLAKTKSLTAGDGDISTPAAMIPLSSSSEITVTDKEFMDQVRETIEKTLATRLVEGMRNTNPNTRDAKLTLQATDEELAEAVSEGVRIFNEKSQMFPDKEVIEQLVRMLPADEMEVPNIPEIKEALKLIKERIFQQYMVLAQPQREQLLTMGERMRNVPDNKGGDVLFQSLKNEKDILLHFFQSSLKIKEGHSVVHALKTLIDYSNNKNQDVPAWINICFSQNKSLEVEEAIWLEIIQPEIKTMTRDQIDNWMFIVRNPITKERLKAELEKIA